MNYIQISIPLHDPAMAEILIACLSEEGYDGFEEKEEEGLLLAFIPELNFDAKKLEAQLGSWQLSYSLTAIPPRNWNEEWEKNFHPIVVGSFCAVRAAFHAPVVGVEHELIITPKMSFGTGHHATTYMMLEAMQHLDFAGADTLDLGTGTGVLAILAEKLGSLSVLAIDHDAWSIENAGENIRTNHCRAITLIKADRLPPNLLFSIILANINKNVIIQELPAMGQQLAPGGVILLSGLLKDDCEDVERAALQNNITISGRMAKGNWICLAGKKIGRKEGAD